MPAAVILVIISAKEYILKPLIASDATCVSTVNVIGALAGRYVAISSVYVPRFSLVRQVAN